ncbi:MAG: type II toxin-antitoxin system RelE/ParE family toxin [bacterium]
MNVTVLEDALADLTDGYRFYERQSGGLGTYFLDSLWSDIDSLAFFGGIHPTYLGYHRLLSKRFPFAVFYRMEGNAVQVRAILDCRRNPAWIREKMK